MGDEDGQRKRSKRTTTNSNLKEFARTAVRLMDQVHISRKFNDVVQDFYMKQYNIVVREKKIK